MVVRFDPTKVLRVISLVVCLFWLGLQAQAGSLFDPLLETPLTGDLSGATAIAINTGATPPTINVTGILNPGVQNGVVRTVGGIDVAVFCFGSVNLGVAPTVTGSRPLAILSQGAMTIGANITINGAGGGNRAYSTGTTLGGAGVAGGYKGGDIVITGADPNYYGYAGEGPGGGFGYAAKVHNRGGGGGYGGPGGGGIVNPTGGGVTYNDVYLSWLEGGSGGGAGTRNTAQLQSGGAGGGAIELAAIGTLTINTGVTISANGGSTANYNGNSGFAGCGGGSGGAIRLSGANVVLNGTLSANGGNGGTAINGNANSYTQRPGGGGGGGRVAIYYATSFTGAGAVTVNGGAKGTAVNGKAGKPGTRGTIYVQKDGLTPANTVYARFNPADFPSIGTVLPGQSVAFDTDRCLATVGGTPLAHGMHVPTSSGTLVAVFCFSSFNLAGQTANVTGSYPIAILSQSDLNVGGTLNANGAAGSLNIGGVGAGGKGAGGHLAKECFSDIYSSGFGDGASSGSYAGNWEWGSATALAPTGPTASGTGGAGYGGVGGDGPTSLTIPVSAGGLTYGTTPLYDLLPGSGSGASLRYGGSSGGGAIELVAAGSLTIPAGGIVSANGGLGGGDNQAVNNGSGGGSGGAVLLSGDSVAINGTIRANGGDGAGVTGALLCGGGGGGGGRIAVYSAQATVMGAAAFLTVNPGLPRGAYNPGLDGTTGTIFLAPSLGVNRNPVKMKSAVDLLPLVTSFTIVNRNAGTLQIQTVAVTDPGTPAVFSIPVGGITNMAGAPIALPYTMAGLESIAVNVAFNRSAPVSAIGAITITSDDPGATSYVVVLTGRTSGAGADWLVTPDGLPGGVPGGLFQTTAVTTLQNAVDNGMTDDNVYLLEGVYDLSNPLGGAPSGELLPLEAMNFFGGFDGSESLGGRSGLASDRATTFLIDNPTTLSGGTVNRHFNINNLGSVRLDGLIFADGYYAGNGGSIFASGTTMTLDQCVFYNNMSNAGGITGGGAIYVSGGTNALNISRSLFTSNTANYAAGAIYCNAQTAVTSCSFMDGRALSNYAGAIRSDGGSLLMTGCLFFNNTASGGDGGAVFIRNNATPTTAVQCVFASNSASANAGALGVYNGANSLVTAINCVFSKNQAGGTGGAFYAPTSTLGSRFINCTFAYNSCAAAGMHDGIYLDGAATVTANVVLNCVFEGHRIAVDTDTTGALVSIFNTVTGLNGANALLDAVPVNCLAADPQFADAANGDLRLGNNSPAIGFGAAAALDLFAPADDLNGVLRGTPPDAGAYENALNSPSGPGPIQDVRYAMTAPQGAADGSSWSNAATLPDAIALVSSGGAVLVSSGTYPVASPLIIGKAVSIYGGCLGTETTPSARQANFMSLSPTTVTAGGAGRVLLAQNLSYLVLDGVNVADGYLITGDGAGLYYCAAQTLTIRNAVFSNNIIASPKGVGGRGGALATTSTDQVILSDSVFVDNCSSATGGAIFYDTPLGLTADRCVFNNNKTLGAYDGGGIFANVGALTLNACAFTSHSAYRMGAAVYSNGALTVSGCVMTSNATRDLSGGGGGGAVFGPTGNPVNFNNSVFIGNTSRMGGAFRAGGGVHAVTVTSCVFEANFGNLQAGALFIPNNAIILNVSNSIFRNNETLLATANGGAINCDTAAIPTITNCLFYGNKARGTLGGAISVNATAGMKVVNCTFSNNVALAGIVDGINWGSPTNPMSNVILNCVFYGHRVAVSCPTAGMRGYVYNSAFDNLIIANAVVCATPVNCVYGEVALVNPAAGDCHLRNYSVAIGAGALAAGGMTEPALDLDGVTRPLPAGTNPDAGAFENVLRGIPDPNPTTIPVVYVTVAGAGTMDGSSWDNATTLPPALGIVQPGGRIFMKGGPTETHNIPNALTVAKAVSIYGGFAGVPAENDQSKRPATYLTDYPTTISGQNLYRIFYFQQAGPVTLDALNLDAGNNTALAGNGGGIFVEACFSFAMRDCGVTNCQVTSEGGALKIFGTPFTLTRCLLSGNKTYNGRGAGLATDAASGLIEDCSILNNAAGAAGYLNPRGGGLSLYNSAGGTIILRGTTVSGNQVWDNGGAGMHLYDNSSSAQFFIDNCVISGNLSNGGSIAISNYAAGIMAQATSIITITNSSVVNNITGNSGGANNLACGIGVHDTVAMTLNNVIISGNRLINDNIGDCYGAGMLIRDNSRVTMSNCRVIENLCYNTGAAGAASNDRTNGGGLAIIDTAQVAMANCQVNDNASSTAAGAGADDAYGGGIYMQGTSILQMTSCSITGNIAYSARAGKYGCGGGVAMRDGTQVTLTNCILARNSSGYGGGAVRAYDSATAAMLLKMVNCTVIDNTMSAAGNQADGVFIADLASIRYYFINCLFDGQQRYAIYSMTDPSPAGVAYNCVFGNHGSNSLRLAAGNTVNCQPDADPLLADYAGGNYDLTLLSPAVDTGLTQTGANAALGAGVITVPSQDILGRARLYPAPGIPDIGAYELLRANLVLTPDPFHFGVVDAGTSVTSTITVANTGNMSYNFTAGNWATSGAPFSIVTPFAGQLTPGASGTMDLAFAPAALGDYAGELGYSDVAVPLSSATLRGATPPQVISITRLDGNPTSAALVGWLVTLSQPVVNADPTDFSIATTGSFPVAPTVLSVVPAGATLTVTANSGTGEGQIQLVLDAASDIAEATYLAPLVNKPFAGEIYTLDTLAPVVVSIIARDGGSAPTSATSVIFDVTFSEPVSGVTQANFAFLALDAFTTGSITSVSNAAGATTAAVWQVAVGGLTASNAMGGYLRLDLSDPAGIADQLYNPLTGTFIGGSVWVDDVAPSFNPLVNVNPTSGSVVSAVRATTVTFSEPVTGVTADKLTITTDGVTIYTPVSVLNVGGDQRTYAFTITDVFGAGPVVLNMTLVGTSGTTIRDAAGNPFSLERWSIIKDSSVISVEISSTQVSDGGLTSLTQVFLHAHFQEGVTGFDPETQPGDLLLGNCVYVTGTLSGSGMDYDFAVQPIAQGPASVRIPAAICLTTILPPRNNGTSNLYSITFDQILPVFTNLTVIPSRAQLGSTVTLIFTASEILMANPLVTVNAHAAAFASKAGANYTYLYIPISSDPESTATIAMTGTDLAGNTSTTVDNTTLFIDKTAPVATIQPVSPDGGALVTVDFSEEVTGVDVTDFILTQNGVPIIGIANFTVVNSRQCTFIVPNAAPAVYVLRLQAAGSNIRDLAGILLAADVTETWVVAEGAAAVELWSRY